MSNTKEVFGMAAVIVEDYTYGTKNVNGVMPLIMTPLAGRLPNRNVIDGTVAEVIGIEAGKTYVVKTIEGKETKEWGRTFTFKVIKEIDAIDAVDYELKIGIGQLVDVPKGTIASDPTKSAAYIAAQMREAAGSGFNMNKNNQPEAVPVEELED